MAVPHSGIPSPATPPPDATVDDLTADTVTSPVATITTATISAARFKGEPWHDVMAYGATGDGTTDDTVAVQAAIDAAGVNGTVVLPALTYLISTTLTFPSGLRMIGRSGPQVQAGQAVLSWGGIAGGTLIAPAVPVSNTINPQFENIRFSGGANAAIVVDLTRTSYALFERCAIDGTRASAVGFLLDAVTSGQCYFNRLDQCKVQAPVGARFTRGANSNQVNGGAFIGCGTGMEFLSLSAGNVVVGTDMETSSVRHVYVDAVQNTFIGVHMEAAPIGYELTANSAQFNEFGTTYATSVTTPISEAAGARDQLAHTVRTAQKPRWAAGLWRMAGDWIGSSTPWEFDALPFSGTASSLFRFFRNTTTTGARQLILFKGDGTATSQIVLNAATGDVSAVGKFVTGPTLTVQILNGTGTPEGAVVADPGSLYLNRSGGAGTTLYVKQTGFGTNTGWVGK